MDLSLSVFVVEIWFPFFRALGDSSVTRLRIRVSSGAFSVMPSGDGDLLGDPVPLMELSGFSSISEEETSTTIGVVIVGALGLSSILRLNGILGVLGGMQ